MPMTVRKLLDEPLLGLTVAAGEAGLDRIVATVEINRPALELTGYFEAFRAERIQVLGNGEVAYIESHLRSLDLLRNLNRVLSGAVPCAVVANGRQPPALIIDRANEVGIPLLSCPHGTTKLYKRIWEALEVHFAPETTMHGVLMEVHDIGVLILGDSGVGKSECALELIRRGFHLVADDMVTIKCLSDSILLGTGSDLLPYHMEVRGLGIIDISRLFGTTAIRQEKRVSMAITLVEWEDSAQYDRTGLGEETMSILDVPVPHVTLPVKPGRSSGALVEIAALNQKLKYMGVHTARMMQERLVVEMARTSPESPEPSA